MHITYLFLHITCLSFQEAKTELQRNALAEARRKELDLYQRALDIKWLNSRMEDGRMGRTLALIKREDEMEKDYKEVHSYTSLALEHGCQSNAMHKILLICDRFNKLRVVASQLAPTSLF